MNKSANGFINDKYHMSYLWPCEKYFDFLFTKYFQHLKCLKCVQ